MARVCARCYCILCVATIHFRSGVENDRCCWWGQLCVAPTKQTAQPLTLIVAELSNFGRQHAVLCLSNRWLPAIAVVATAASPKHHTDPAQQVSCYSNATSPTGRSTQTVFSSLCCLHTSQVQLQTSHFIIIAILLLLHITRTKTHIIASYPQARVQALESELEAAAAELRVMESLQV